MVLELQLDSWPHCAVDLVVQNMNVLISCTVCARMPVASDWGLAVSMPKIRD